MTDLRGMTLLTALVASVALTACGGGGSSSTSPSPSPAPAPTPAAAPPATGTPTGTIASSQTDATALATAAKTGSASLVGANSLGGLPLGLLVAPPNGVTSTSVACPYGGTYSYSGSFTGTSGTPVSGDSWTGIFTNCSFASGDSINGTVAYTFTNYTSATNFAFTVTATNVTYNYGTGSWGPGSFTAQYADTNGTFSYSYVVNGTTVVGQPSITVSGANTTIGSGSINVNYGGGWVTVVYSGWVFNTSTGLPSAGTATITAANGSSATITVTSTGYLVTYSPGNGSFTVPFS